jgi:hypothetical protein
MNDRIREELIETFLKHGIDLEIAQKMADDPGIRKIVKAKDSGKGWESKFEIVRYDNQKDYDAKRIYSEEESLEKFGTLQRTIIEAPGNLLLNGGITNFLNLGTVTGSPTGYSAAQATIGIGNSSTAEVATQTNLQATPQNTSNTWFQLVDSTYPQVSGQTATFQATIAGANANMTWAEFCITTGGIAAGQATNSSVITLCRKVSAQGIKTSGQIWTIIYTVTLS